MGKEKYYVVWKGRKTGIFNNWNECKEQIVGFEGAAYKSFKSEEDARSAFLNPSKTAIFSKQELSTRAIISKKPLLESISVDGAGNNLNGVVEYRGVYTRTKEVLFSRGPFEGGTNNLVEFLAIVHALAYCKDRNITLPIYSDSIAAISWVRNKKIKTTAIQDESNKKIFEYVKGAINWLNNNAYSNNILKWETHLWGEIPADYGRK
jgi:ribonuclease HI